MICEIHKEQFNGYEVIETSEKFLACPMCVAIAKSTNQAQFINKSDFVQVRKSDLKRWVIDSISQGRYDDKAISKMIKEIRVYLGKEG